MKKNELLFVRLIDRIIAVEDRLEDIVADQEAQRAMLHTKIECAVDTDINKPG